MTSQKVKVEKYYSCNFHHHRCLHHCKPITRRFRRGDKNSEKERRSERYQISSSRVVRLHFRVYFQVRPFHCPYFTSSKHRGRNKDMTTQPISPTTWPHLCSMLGERKKQFQVTKGTALFPSRNETFIVVNSRRCSMTEKDCRCDSWPFLMVNRRGRKEEK